ncbi:ABC transporter ATP-binding protein [Brevibacterium aurantiacum]|uniref:ABC transporter ATP-binding protein n=1 Tax=Brevibacterium aurantiacum TaxID=273384 RepID=UPI003F8FBEDB
MTTPTRRPKTYDPKNPSATGGRLRGTQLTLAYDRREICRDLNVKIPQGKVTVIIGPNASGKSTVLRALARLINPTDGAVLLDETDVRRYAPKEFARRLGILPQTSTAPVGITVSELVTRGRFPHQRALRTLTEADTRAVEHAMAATRIAELADRPVAELSGGQRQRVWIAMLLAQQAPVMLLDEPTTYLDVSHQLEVLELVRGLNQNDGRTIVLVLHDLNQAVVFADELIVVSQGQIVARGTPQQVMTGELLRDVFGIEARILHDPELTAPVIVPLTSVANTR